MKGPEPRWRRGVKLLDESVGELLGHLYVERHFTPAARERVLQLVDNLLKAFDVSIGELEWMSPETRAEPKSKLASFAVKLGYFMAVFVPSLLLTMVTVHKSRMLS